MIELSKIGEYAPGIPSNKKIKKIDIQQGFTQLLIQKHHAHKAGKHLDFRISGPGGLYSWAIKDLPKKPGTNVLAVQQPTHTHDYASFEGKIESGYGAGTVKKHLDENVDIAYANKEKIKLISPTLGPMALINLKDKNNWLLVKMKPFKGSITHKPKYKSTDISAIDVNDKNQSISSKIDGAHSIVELGRTNHIYSYRKSKKTGLPIDHTNQLPSIRDMRTPDDLRGTILRTEVYAKGAPAETISGILNSSLELSREKQKKYPLIPSMFNIIRYGRKNVEDAPYSEKIKMMEDINKRLPNLHLPDMAITPKAKKKLIHAIRSGKHPETKEGVIVHNLNEPESFVKAKIRNEYDKYIRTIDPKQRRVGFSSTKIGPIQGWVGTGISNELNRHLHDRPKDFIGKKVRLNAQQEFSSGALRAPSWAGLHIGSSLV
jgi:hypothetical protein